MKRFLLSTIMVVIGLSAFSQSPSRIISLQPAYPLVVGESTASGVTFDSNALSLTDTPLDSLPHYEIGQIFEQIVRCYTDEGHGFYVKADSLHSVNVTYSYEFAEGSEQPKGTIEFNPSIGRFKYFPAADDYKSFTITFTATNGTETITEDVLFGLMPRTPSETTIFHSEGVLPDAGDYIVKAETSTKKYLNNQERTAYSISLSGKDVIFDNAVKNKVWGLSGRQDIYELNIYAERLIVRSALTFPQTDITIYAKELIFEDTGGVTASINTSPSSDKTLTDGQGAHGGDAGNITLNIKEMKSNMALRFILNGADGQSTNRNGTPGNGGNGGTVRSTIDVSSFCDLARGSAGVRYDVDPGGTTQQGPPASYGKIGSEGSFVLVDNPYAYLHPYYLSVVIRHANDAFINNYTDYALQTCREYRSLISELLTFPVKDNNDSGNGTHEGAQDDLGGQLGTRTNNVLESTDTISKSREDLDWSTPGIEEDVYLGLQKDLMEINNMLFRLEQGLDYFGNPAGWVPLLSFEVYLKNYDNEIDRAVPTLYMYYWLSRVDKTLQNMVRASNEAARQTEEEIDKNVEHYNSLIQEIPVLQNEADGIDSMITELTIRIEKLQDQLMAQAVKSVKKKHKLLGIFSIGKTIANVVSVFGPWGTAIGGTLSAGLSIASNSIDISTGSDYSKALKDIGDKKVDTIATKDKDGKDLDGLTFYNTLMEKNINPLVNNINNLANVLSKNSTNSEIQAEYNRLKANSPEWNKMEGQFEELNAKKDALVQHINQVFTDMTTTSAELSNDALALDAFRRDAFKGNSKRDLNAMLYIEKMQQRAKSRMLKYDYYLRKAYEYRFLKPYEYKEFNLNGMYDRLQSVGLALDSVVDTDAYRTLSAVYRERVSDMTEEIIEEYTNNSHTEKTSTPRSYRIPREKLDELNANGSVNLNMYEMGFFSPMEENIRILNFGVRYIKAHAEGELGYWGELSLEMSHSGISKFRKNGNIYYFNHMPPKTKNPHVWTTKVDIFDLPEVTNPQTDKTSVEISSLMSSILNYDNDKIMLFSRPSVWSDITLTKRVNVETEEEILIDSLVLLLEYDYTRRTEDLSNIDISASDGLMPYINCSVEDVCGRSSGRGPLFRSFQRSNSNVTFTAQDKYETYYFVNWTTRAGKVVSDKPALTVNCQQDQRYIANYERRVPILSVADTVRVGNAGGTYRVSVKNIGGGDTEMDWYVEDSLSVWTHINGADQGIDDGEFSIVCEANATGNERVDSIKIYAPETDEMSRIVYVVQSSTLRGDVDGDGRVSAVDVWTLMGIIARGGTTPEFPRADLNGDGRIDVADVMCVTAIVSKGGQ